LKRGQKDWFIRSLLSGPSEEGNSLVQEEGRAKKRGGGEYSAVTNAQSRGGTDDGMLPHFQKGGKRTVLEGN